LFFSQNIRESSAYHKTANRITMQYDPLLFKNQLTYSPNYSVSDSTLAVSLLWVSAARKRQKSST
jgi:hypothetical protein